MLQKYFQFGKLREDKDKVLVVPQELAFEHGEWQGFLMGTQWGSYFEKVAETKGEYLPRVEVEDTIRYQQLIPWAVVRYQNYYLMFKRGQEGPHSRLYGRYSMGIEGHVFEEEMQELKTLRAWVKKKFLEEVEYKGNLEMESIGVVNDNSDALGKHHIGLVFLIDLDSADLVVKPHEDVELVPLSEIRNDTIAFMDRWSQMVFRQLRDLERYGSYEG